MAVVVADQKAVELADEEGRPAKRGRFDSYPGANSIRRELIDSVLGGRLSLSTAVMELKGFPHDSWFEMRIRHEPTVKLYMTQILCLLSTKLINSIIMGTLPSTSRSNHAIRHELDIMENSPGRIPGIYIMYLTDAEGLRPTWAEWSKVLDALDLYGTVSDTANDLASRIDMMYHTRAKNTKFIDRRKYLLTETDSKNPEIAWTEERRTVLTNFISTMRGVISREGEADIEIRRRRPVTEVGYSLSPADRIRSHQRHESSNYVMGLCSATFNVMFPGNTFTLEGYIVCRCHRMEQAAVGEVLFSTLAGACTTFGTGFSHHGAGLSNASAEQVRYMD